MKYILFLTLFFLIFSLSAFDEDFWYDYSGIISIDPSTGLTSWSILDIPES